MGDDYWRDHRDYVERKRFGNVSMPKSPKVVQEPICDVCKKRFKSIDLMRQHRKGAHGKGTP